MRPRAACSDDRHHRAGVRAQQVADELLDVLVLPPRFGNRPRRRGAVARDHDDLNAGPARLADGIPDLRPGWIAQPHEAEEGRPLLLQVRLVGGMAHGKGNDALAPAGHLAQGRFDCGSVWVAQAAAPVAVTQPSARPPTSVVRPNRHPAPSRTTSASGESMARSASSAVSARHSCTKPRIAFRARTRPIATASSVSPKVCAISAAAIRTTTGRFRNRRIKIAKGNGVLISGSAFRPKRARRGNLLGCHPSTSGAVLVVPDLLLNTSAQPAA